MMMLEAWERLRGRNGWVEMPATIVSTTSAGESWLVSVKGGKQSRYKMYYEVNLRWSDQIGYLKEGKVRVDQASPVYRLGAGGSVTIRYNPADPRDFYLREQARYGLRKRARAVLGLLIVIGWLVGTIVFSQ